MRVEQERIRLSARLEELPAQQELVIYSPPHHSTLRAELTSIDSQGNIGGSSLDEYTQYGESPTSPPPSSASTKIGSASVDEPSLKRRQLDAIFIPTNCKLFKTPVTHKSIGKPSAGGTRTQTKTVTNTTRPVQDKAAPKQKSAQNSDGCATEGPVQKVISRVHTVGVNIKIEDDEDGLLCTPVNDTKWRAPPDNDSKPSKTVKRATKPVGPQRTGNKGLPAYMDDDATPAPVPRRRKSKIDEEDYYEPSGDAYSWQSREDANVRRWPPPRRKSIRELRESDFEYHEEEEDEETDADELNLRVRLSFDVLSWR